MHDSSSHERSPSPSLLRYEELVARALTAADPAAAFQEASRDSALTAELRGFFANADGDGVRLAAVLIARLRFERLIRGSQGASDWFERDPEAFTRSFRSYHHAVPPRALFPLAEARDFESWLSSQSGSHHPRAQGAPSE